MPGGRPRSKRAARPAASLCARAPYRVSYAVPVRQKAQTGPFSSSLPTLTTSAEETFMKQQTTIQAAIAGLFALGLAGSVAAGPVAPDASKDKCFGIAKAGQNDCAAGKHACAGQ